MESQKRYYAVRNYLNGTFAFCNSSNIVWFATTPMLMEKEAAEDLCDRLMSWKSVNPVLVRVDVLMEVL